MDYDNDAWRRLAQAVIDRRTELDRTQMEVAQRGGLSLDRVSAIERAEARNLRPKTIKSLETGLNWTPGSVRAVLEGGTPNIVHYASASLTPAAGSPVERRLAEVADRSLSEMLDEAEALMAQVERGLDDRRRRRFRRLWELAREEVEESAEE